MDSNEPPPSPPAGRALQSSPRNYAVGIALLVGVVGMWVSSSFLMSSIFRDQSFDRPWLIYLCTSFFALYLIKPGCYLLLSLWWADEHRGRKSSSASPSRGSYIALADDEAPNQGQPRASRARSISRAYSVSGSPLTHQETARLAAQFVGIWFAANWTVNASLRYTSVSSTTILSSTSGFFTLCIGAFFGVERFGIGPLAAVVISTVGVILVSKADHDTSTEVPSDPHANSSGRALFGDGLALSSAMLYACYVLLMKVKVKSESRIDMQLFFGWVGLYNILFLWPIGVLLHLTGVEPFALPDNSTLWLSVIVNGLLTFVSDYLYMLAMLKTSPLVVTLGLSLTLPVAVFGDIFKGVQVDGAALLGAAMVLASFGVLSWAQREDHAELPPPPSM